MTRLEHLNLTEELSTAGKWQWNEFNLQMKNYTNHGTYISK